MKGTPENGFQLKLQITGGEREYSGANCRPLIQAAALYVSLLLEEGAEPTLPIAPPEKEREPSPAPLPPSPGPPKLQAFFGLAWGLDTGSFPRLTHLGTAYLGAARGDYSLRLRVHWAPRESLDVEEGPLHLGWFSAGILGCYSLLQGELGRVAGCLGVDAGKIDFSAPQAEAPNQGSLALISSALGLETAWTPDRHFAVTLAGEWSQPLLGAQVYLRDSPEDRLVSESASALRVRLGLEIPF